MSQVFEIESSAPTRKSNCQIRKLKWLSQNPPQHEFLAIACPEDEGGFSIFAAHIPGVVSQGESQEEASQNIKEAFVAMLEACKKRNQPLPYSARPTIDAGSDCLKIWVTLDG